MATSKPNEQPSESVAGRATHGRTPFERRGCPWRSVAALTLLIGLTGCKTPAQTQNTTGTAFYQQGQYTAAMAEFQKAISSDPRNADGYYNLAATMHRLGVQQRDGAMLGQAESLYNQCLDHSPNHVECHRGLAVLLVDTGRPDRAFALMKNWAAQNPNLSEPQIELARLYEEAKEPQTAQKYLENAIQVDPNNPRAWLALGRLREVQGDLVQASQNYQRSLAINPSQPMVTERIAAINRSLAGQPSPTFSQGGTRMAQPINTVPTRY